VRQVFNIVLSDEVIYFLNNDKSYGDERDTIPHPALNQKEFVAYIDRHSKEKVGKTWNAFENAMKPWVDPHKIGVEF